MVHQAGQEPELGRRQVNRRPGSVDRPAFLIQHEVSEAERRRRPVNAPGDRKEANRQYRDRQRQERSRRQQALSRGEAWALPARDRGSVKALTFVLYLDGNGNAMQIGADAFQVTQGIAFDQGGSFSLAGPYALSGEGVLVTAAGGVPWSAVGPVSRGVTPGPWPLTVLSPCTTTPMVTRVLL